MKSDYPRLYGAPITTPDQVRQLLRDPEIHWKKGRSAWELSHAWLNADGLPASVVGLLNTATEWREPRLISGFFEHGTALDTMRGPSWTDLLALVSAGGALGVVAVEGKAGESFGPLVRDWLTTPARRERLGWACRMFGVDEDAVLELRWQLFHRVASALIEANRYCASRAIMLVHDFSAGAIGLGDYSAFATAIGINGACTGALSELRTINGISLRLGWLQDKPA